jgi:flagellum-specific peptidoglycan hydrolase FlgJ
MTNIDFITKYLPYAERVKQELGQPVTLTLAQWAHETGMSTSKLSQQSNNLGGIKYTRNSETAHRETRIYSAMNYARYDSLDDFTTDYIRVMNLDYYKDVRKAYSTPEISDDILQLGLSPYAEDKNYSIKVQSIANNFKEFIKSNSISEVTTPAAVSDLSQSDMMKYAGIGLAAATLISLLKA